MESFISVTDLSLLERIRLGVFRIWPSQAPQNAQEFLARLFFDFERCELSGTILLGPHSETNICWLFDEKTMTLSKIENDESSTSESTLPISQFAYNGATNPFDNDDWSFDPKHQRAIS